MSEGYAYVNKQNRGMYFDHTGQNAFPEWDIREIGIVGFLDGLALITVEDGSSEGKTIVIDKQGNIFYKVPRNLATMFL